MRQRIAASHGTGIALVPTLDAASLATMDDLGKQTRCDLLSNLISIFLDDTRNVMRDLEAGVGCGDAATIHRLAHRLKGSCSNFGARALMAVCAELEDLGRTGEIEGAAEVFERVEGEYEQVRCALEQVLAGRRRARS